MTLNELFQAYVDMSFDQLVTTVKSSASAFLQVMAAASDTKEEMFQKFVLAISSIVCVDGVVNRKECEFYNAVFCQNLSYEQFNELFKDNNSAELRNAIDEFVDFIGREVNSDLKAEMINVFLGFAACNGTISKEEVQYLAQLIA